jgi:hypothetical protein
MQNSKTSVPSTAFKVLAGVVTIFKSGIDIPLSELKKSNPKENSLSYEQLQILESAKQQLVEFERLSFQKPINKKNVDLLHNELNDIIKLTEESLERIGYPSGFKSFLIQVNKTMDNVLNALLKSEKSLEKETLHKPINAVTKPSLKFSDKITEGKPAHAKPASPGKHPTLRHDS